MIHRDAEALLAAGAVLEDLEPDERAAYNAHRAGCVACRRLEVELDHVLADLALVVQERVPPADILGAIRRAIAADAEAAARGAEAPALVTTGRPVVAAVLSPARAPVPAPLVSLDAARDRKASRVPLFAAAGIAAVLGIVAVGLGVRSAGLQQDLVTATAQVAALESQVAQSGGAMTVAMNPGHVTVALHAEPVAPAAQAAVMFLPGSTASYIVADDLPATPPGAGYQLWYADAAGVHGLQTVSFDGNGAFIAAIDADLSNATAVMITLEDAGGATGEPGPQVVFGEL